MNIYLFYMLAIIGALLSPPALGIAGLLALAACILRRVCFHRDKRWAWSVLARAECFHYNKNDGRATARLGTTSALWVDGTTDVMENGRGLGVNIAALAPAIFAKNEIRSLRRLLQ